MNAPRETPMTDAVRAEEQRCGSSLPGIYADLARALERTVAELRAERDTLQSQLVQLGTELAHRTGDVADLQARVEAAIWRLVKLECACPYDPGKEGEGAQLMGPICDRCAAIHLLNGGELPVAKEQPR